MDFETRAIHAGQEPDPATGAIITPIYQTSTFVQEAVGSAQGLRLRARREPDAHGAASRARQPGERAHGVAFSSGLGATTTLMHLVDPGQRVVLIADVYGGVYRMTSQVYEPKGYRFTYVPASEFDDNLASYLDEDVRLVWVETPSNPLLNVVDIAQGRTCGARRRRAARRRQHVCDAVPPAAARPRRRRCRPLDDEVPRRPQRRRRRLRRRRTTTRSPSGSTSCRSRSAPCRARSTPGSCCAG